jgi:hypothetical protein
MSSQEDAQAPPQPAGETTALAPEPRRRRAWGIAAALLAIGAAVALCYAEVWRAGIGEVVPVAQVPAGSPLLHTSRADVTFEAWLAARHARTLLRRPWRLFETEHCAPEAQTLTYGIPFVAMGVLAVPASLVTSNPIAVYNATLALQSALAALAVFALVATWTGKRAAGVAAGLLFAFHPIRLEHITHPAEWDATWTACALLFSERFFAAGRWRDALALAASLALLIAASFYQLLSAAFLLPPFALWLLLRHGAARPPLERAAAVALLVAAAAALLLGPYLAARESARIGERMAFAYANWGFYAPGGTLFLGFSLLALAAVGLCAPRRLALPQIAGDPRIALCAGAALVAFVAAGSDTALRLQALGLGVPDFDPYRALAAWLPGLDAVRGVLRLTSAVHLVACVLAGAGVAALQRLARRHGAWVGAVLAAASLLACFGVPPRPYPWRLDAIRPDPQQIAFFEQLALMGNAGPLLELPLDGVAGPGVSLGAPRILLEAWHGRRTSACFGSFLSSRRRELAAWGDALPARDAVDALRAQGFTTVVLHHVPGTVGAALQVGPFERAAAAPAPTLRSLQQTDAMSAYELLPSAADAR